MEGGVDVLVANAGYLSEPDPINEAQADKCYAAFNVNVKGSFALAQSFLERANGNAGLIDLTTAFVHLPVNPWFSSCKAYKASKTAAHVVFRGLQAENPHIKVIGVHPGIAETTMSAKARKGNRFPESGNSRACWKLYFVDFIRRGRLPQCELTGTLKSL